MKTIFKIGGEGIEGFMINRYLFGQRLLREAIDAGANLMDSTQVTEPLTKSGFVNGLVTTKHNPHRKVKQESRAVIDASGHSAVIRKNLPPDFGIETRIDKQDVMMYPLFFLILNCLMINSERH